MDSLNIISDIGKHITELNEKLDKNSKATTIAFSYLYSKIEDLDKNQVDSKKLSERVTYFKTALSDTNSDISRLSSYVTKLNNDSNNYIINTVSPLEAEIKDIKKEISDIKESITIINEFIKKIEETPDNYILIRKENNFKKFIDKINNFFYRIFHQKQIKEQIRLQQEEEERKRLEEEERKRKIEEENKRKIELKRIEEEKKKEESRKKIKELIKK